MEIMVRAFEEKDNLNRLTPKKFNMWIFVFTSFMFFAALTSAFIVYSSRPGFGLKIILPQAFKVSTAMIILSSVTMFMASKAAKNLQFAKQRTYLWLSILFGALFFAIQIYAWFVLIHMGAYLVNPNASQSFIYVFTGMHLLHIVGGIGLLIYNLVASYKNVPQFKNLFNMEFAGIFWHFVDIIWIYLYVFLLLNQ
jgi:cytochrome c oxidase subunit 3